MKLTKEEKLVKQLALLLLTLEENPREPDRTYEIAADRAADVAYRVRRGQTCIPGKPHFSEFLSDIHRAFKSQRPPKSDAVSLGLRLGELTPAQARLLTRVARAVDVLDTADTAYLGHMPRKFGSDRRELFQWKRGYRADHGPAEGDRLAKIHLAFLIVSGRLS